MNIGYLIILPFLLSSLVAFSATPLVSRLAKKLRLVDDPKIHHPKKIHKVVIPRAGGLACLIAVVVSTLLFLPLDKHIIAIVAGATVLVVVGLLDDYFDLSPLLRLISNLVVASLPIIAGIGIAYVSNPFGKGLIDLTYPQFEVSLFGNVYTLNLLADLLAVLWIVILMNFLNMGAKGVPGQLPGVAVIASIAVVLLSLSFSADITEWPVTILASITAGSFFGFLYWNFWPQRIMPGYSGSTLAGFMLGVLSILTTTKVGVITIVLAVPLIDTVFVILNRIRLGKNPMRGDTTHLHHKLLSIGFSQKKVAYFYWSVSALLGLIALGLNSFSKIVMFFAIFAAFGGLVIIIDLYLKNDSRSN